MSRIPLTIILLRAVFSLESGGVDMLLKWRSSRFAKLEVVNVMLMSASPHVYGGQRDYSPR